MSPKLIDRYQREVEAQKRAKERKDAIEQRNRRRHAVLCAGGANARTEAMLRVL